MKIDISDLKNEKEKESLVRFWCDRALYRRFVQKCGREDVYVKKVFARLMEVFLGEK